MVIFEQNITQKHEIFNSGVRKIDYGRKPNGNIFKGRN
jgi:hypothetical protein